MWVCVAGVYVGVGACGGGCGQGIYINRYTQGVRSSYSLGIPTRVVGTCFCGEAREADSNLPI